MRTNSDYANSAISYLKSTLGTLETSRLFDGMDKVNYIYDMMTVSNDNLTLKLMNIDDLLERIYVCGYVKFDLVKRQRLITRTEKAIKQAIKMFSDLATA